MACHKHPPEILGMACGLCGVGVPIALGAPAASLPQLRVARSAVSEPESKQCEKWLTALSSRPYLSLGLFKHASRTAALR